MAVVTETPTEVNVTRKEAVKTLNVYHKMDRWERVTLAFRRQTPKCPNCGKHSVKWSQVENATCDKCGAKVEYVEVVNVQYVTHTKRDADKIRYYDENWRVRQCLIANLLWVGIGNRKYTIV